MRIGNRSRWLAATLVLGLVALTAIACPQTTTPTSAGGQEAKALDGAGATFPAVLYTKWFSDYEKAYGVKVNYQAIGSGGGIKGIQDRTVDFGGSDAPMTDEQIASAGGEVLHIPTALGAVAVTYNIAGLTKPLRLTPETLGGIFLGEIKKWNDPRLLADNPEAPLPNADIVVVHRSDGSGTTFIFTDYLSEVNATWKARVGKGTAVNWPVGLGGKGNPGVAGEIKANANSIGYVELIYALQNNLGVATIRNKSGFFAAPTLESTTMAAAGVTDTIAADLRASIVNPSGAAAYPIAGFTWLLAFKQQTDAPKALALTRMLMWAINDGQKECAALGYAPLPEGIVKKADAMIRSIAVDGKPAYQPR